MEGCVFWVHLEEVRGKEDVNSVLVKHMANCFVCVGCRAMNS